MRVYNGVNAEAVCVGQFPQETHAVNEPNRWGAPADSVRIRNDVVSAVRRSRNVNQNAQYVLRCIHTRSGAARYSTAPDAVPYGAARRMIRRERTFLVVGCFCSTRPNILNSRVLNYSRSGLSNLTASIRS